MKNILLYLLAIAFLFTSCEEGTEGQKSDIKTNQDTPKQEYISDYSFQYKLFEPTLTFKLPNKLTEISGLSISSDDNYLLAINDEHGDYFIINKLTGEVTEEREFGSVGDYEGIEMVGENIYMVQNNGIISEVSFTKKDEPTVIYKTELNASYDVEGLGYDKSKNQLLIACKGKAGKGKEFKGKRAVYSFDLKTKELSTTPKILFKKKDIKEKSNGIGKKRIESFGFSGIATHPLTNDIYALSSPGKMLVVLDHNGELLHVEDLQNLIFKQPEGICFDKDGHLYISTEGKGGKGEIFVFGR